MLSFLNKKFKQITANILALVMLVTSIPVTPLTLYADQIDGINVSIQWSGNSSADDIDWYATTSQNRSIVLQVNYKFNKAKISKDGFEPGDIEIKIPGIGKVNRAYVKKAQVSIGSGESQVWRLDEYDSVEDIYTFKNSRRIDSETSFAGSFSLIWDLSSRDIITESYEEIEGIVQAKEIKGKTNKIRFKFVSEVDTYEIGAYCDGFDTPDGLNDFLEGEPEDFYWVKLAVNPRVSYKSRGTKNTYYIARFPENAVIRKSTGSYEDLGNNEYKLGHSNITLWITYPKDEIGKGEILEHYFELYGTYLDTTEEVLLAEDNVSITPSDYDFTYNGYINSVGKSGNNTSGQYAIIKSRLYNGITLPYYFKIRARYRYSPKRSSRRARVASPSNAEILNEFEDESKFVAPNYLDTLSDEELADEEAFLEAIEEARNRYNQALEEYEEEVYLRELEEEEDLEEDKELIDDRDEIKEEIEDIEEEMKEHIVEEETKETESETEKGEEETTEKIEETKGDIEETKELESETEELEESIKETIEDIKETEEAKKVTLDKELEISKKDTNIVKSSFRNSIATSSNAVKKDEEEIDNEGVTAPNNTSTYSLENTGTGMDIVIMDDFLEITSANGELVELNDNEYRMTSIKIPSNSSFINANGYAVKPNKYTIEVYSGLYGSEEARLVQSFKLNSNSRTVNFPSDTRHCFIKILAVNESLYMSGMTLSVAFNLDQDNPILDNGKIRNLMGLIVEQNGEITNIPDDNSYTGIDRERVRERDNNTYGHNIQRDLFDYYYQSDKVYHSVSVSTSGFKQQEQDDNGEIVRFDEGYATTVTYSSSITYGDGIRGWSVYSLLPLGMEVDESKLNNNASIKGFYTENDDLVEKLSRSQFKLEVVKDYRSSGRTLVKGLYNFSDETITSKESTGTASFSVPVYVSYNNEDLYGTNYNIKVEQFLDCPGKIILAGYGCGSGIDNGKAFNDGDFWADINENGDTKEKLVYDSTSVSITYVDPTHIEIKKFISAPRTYNKYTTNLVDKKMKDIWASFGCDYSYKLNVYNLGKPATNLVVYDLLEQGYYVMDDDGNIENKVDSKWIGILRRVDTSYIEKLGFHPTVYYTTVTDAKKDINNGQWKTSIEDGEKIKGIAIDFGSRKLISGRNLYVEILMTAPDVDENLIGKEAVNEFSISYRANGKNGELDSNSVYLKIDVPKGLIQINKTGEIDNRELGGYKFSVKDSNNNILAYILDTGMINPDGTECGGLEIGNYKIKEEIAPTGYEILDKEIEVEITSEDVKMGYKVVNVEDLRKPGSVKLIKRDVSDTTLLLNGAMYNLYRRDNKQDDYTLYRENIETDINGEINITDLEWGEYYLKEIKPPLYYYLHGDLEEYFEIEADNLDVIIEMTNRHLGEVVLTKYDGDWTGRTVSGATYALYDNSGKYIDSYITDESGEIHVDGLKWGRYYFIEEEPAEGYLLNSEKISFLVNKSNSIEIIEVETKDYEDVASVKLIKTDSVSGDKLSNAYYRLEKKTSGNYYALETYKTDSLGEIIVDDLKFGDYRFIEVKAPSGYKINNEAVEFKLDIDTVGQEIILKHEDERKTGDIEITKINDNKEKVGDAHFELYKDGEKLDLELITDSIGVAKVSGLEWGTYTLKEVEPVPKGYLLNTEEKTFIIDKDTVNKTIKIEFINERQKGSVKLVKKDELSKNTLSGATYKLYSTDGTELDKGVTDANGEVVFKDIPWGSYYLEESEAPEGYMLSNEKIRFSVNRDNCSIVQELEAEDKLKTTYLTIRKVLNGDSSEQIYEAFDNPTFMFKIEGRGQDGEDHTWFRQIVLDKDNLSGCTILADIPYPDSNGYKITELNATRYELVDKTLTSGGKELSIDTSWPADSVVVHLKDGEDVEVTYINNLKKWDKYSATSNAINMIKKDRKIVYLDVKYNGPNDITDMFVDGIFEIGNAKEFLDEYLEVVAYYDSEDADGNISKVLNYGEYSLEPGILEGQGLNSIYDYTIQVKYEEYNKTKYGSFQVSAKVDSPGYTIYYYDGDELLNSNRYAFGKPVTLYKPDAKIGKTFIGWNTNKDLSGEIISEPYENTSDDTEIYLYAKYEYETYKISYEGDGNFDGFKVSYTMDDLDYKLPTPTIDKKGRRFIGWTGSNGSSPEKEVTIKRGTTGDLTYEAHWELDGATLVSGTTFWYSVGGKSKIKSIKVVDGTVPSGVSTRVVSTKDSLYKVEVYVLDNTLYLVSDAPVIFLNENSSGMFKKFTNLIDIQDLEKLDTEKVVNATDMFYRCLKLTNIDALKDWDVSNVTDMSKMFNECMQLNNLDALRDWDVSNVKNMSQMFDECRQLNNLDALEYWDVSNVTNMSKMFKCNISTNNVQGNLQDISGLKKWDVHNVKDMSMMFASQGKITDFSALKSWDVSNVTDMSSMFRICTLITNLDYLRNWNVSNVTNMSYMFYNDSQLNNISALSEWNVSNVTNMSSMFYRSKLSSLQGLDKWNISRLEDANRMFFNNSKLIDISALQEWDTYNIKNMSHMFYDCVQLSDISALSEWNVSNVTSMSGMFSGINISNLSGLEKWNINKVNTLSTMFSDCTKLNNIQAIKDWDVSNVTDINGLFYYCWGLSDIKALESWDTHNLITMNTVFYNCRITDLKPLKNWDVSNVTSMNSTFYKNKFNSLDGLENWNTSNVKSMSGLFHSCLELNDISALENWNTSNVTNLSSVFNSCDNLTNIDALSNWNTSNVTNLSSVFYNCGITNVNALGNWNTSRVRDMTSIFSSCTNLTNISALSNWNTSNVTNLSSVFYNCGITNVNALGNWNTSRVRDMTSIFSSCTNLTNISALSNWNTSKASTMSNMFDRCVNLKDVTPIVDWNIISVNNFTTIFRDTKVPSDFSFSKRPGKVATNGTYVPN